jgi:hypothetical protein
MHDPHQERDGRERLSVETLGVGSLAFCDMPFSAEHGGPDKPSVLLSPCVYLLVNIPFLNAIVFSVLVRCFGGRVNTVSAQSLDALAMLLHDQNTQTVKTVIGCFGTMYPLLFRSL